MRRKEVFPAVILSANSLIEYCHNRQLSCELHLQANKIPFSKYFALELDSYKAQSPLEIDCKLFRDLSEPKVAILLLLYFWQMIKYLLT